MEIGSTARVIAHTGYSFDHAVIGQPARVLGGAGGYVFLAFRPEDFPPHPFGPDLKGHGWTYSQEHVEPFTTKRTDRTHAERSRAQAIAKRVTADVYGIRVEDVTRQMDAYRTAYRAARMAHQDARQAQGSAEW